MRPAETDESRLRGGESRRNGGEWEIRVMDGNHKEKMECA